ncbi:hypothetical protein LTS18_011701, partial [Coniosporium uncinatum]
MDSALPMLPSLIRLVPVPTDARESDAEDIFTSSLGLIFTDDLQNQHGGLDTLVAYKSRRFDREILLQTADVNGEEERRKFAHYVWNAGILMGELVGGVPQDFGEGQIKWWASGEELRDWDVKGRQVLELGAGTGLGGIISALAGADTVDITDYPAPAILEALKANVARNVPPDLRMKANVEGHAWGELDNPFASEKRAFYSHILVADCLWMAHQHENLAKSIAHFMSPDPEAQALVIAGFHTGRATMAPFFTVVVQEGLEVAEIWECDANGTRRDWNPRRPDENAGERKKWLVVARLRRCT